MKYILVGLMINFSSTFVKDNDGSIKGFPGAKVCKHFVFNVILKTIERFESQSLIIIINLIAVLEKVY